MAIYEKLEKSIVDTFKAIKLISVQTLVASTFVLSILLTNGSNNPLIPELNRVIRTRRNQPGYSGLTRLAKIEFPRFSGNQIKDWVFKIEQFFFIDNTPEDLKVGLASITLMIKQLLGIRRLCNHLLACSLLHDWSSYRTVLMERFDEVLDDPNAELKQLCKTEEMLNLRLFELELICLSIILLVLYLAGLRTDTYEEVIKPKEPIRAPKKFLSNEEMSERRA